MKFTMVDNALDSLDLVMEFYAQLIRHPEDENRLNKIIIIFLHNAMELLLKSILSIDDELSIYDLENDKTNSIVQQAKKSLENNPAKTLHEVLIKDMDIKTLSYGNIVRTYVEKYGCDKRTEAILNKLGSFRNAITHFGVDLSDDEDDFYALIYNSFDVILYVIYDQLLEVDEYFAYNDVRDCLESWAEGAEDYLRHRCILNPGRNMIFCCELFDKVIRSDKFNDFLSAYGIVVSSYRIDEGDYRVSFIYNDEEIYVTSKYSSFHNATIFAVGEEQYIWFIVEHYENRIYMFDTDITYEWYPEQYKMWENYISNGCVSKPLTENNVRNHIVKMLKKSMNLGKE